MRRCSSPFRLTVRDSPRETVTLARETARSGDGCPIEAELTLDVLDDLPLEWPAARTPDSWLTFGFHEDLDAAATIATNGMLDVIERELDVDRSDALGLASVAVDLRVTQVVNGTKGVHAVLLHDAIRFTRIR